MKWGVGWGVGLAAVYSGIAALIAGGAGDAAFRANGTTLGLTIVAYFAGGVVAGALVGVLRPLARTRFGSSAVGAVAGIAVFAAIGMAVSGLPSSWHGADVATILILGTIMGSSMAYRFWKPPQT